MRGETIAAAQKAAIIHDKAELLDLPESSRTNIGNVLTLDAAVAAFNPLCACPIPNASRLAPQAR